MTRERPCGLRTGRVELAQLLPGGTVGVGMSRGVRVGLVAWLTVIAAGGIPGAARSASRVSWSLPVLVDHRAPFGAAFAFSGVSCPSVALCVAVENGGRVVTSRDPSAAARVWRAAQVDRAQGASGAAGLSAVSCPSVSMCVAVDSVGDVPWSAQPTGGPTAWRTRRVDPGVALTG
jgi:hypothetical protein